MLLRVAKYTGFLLVVAVLYIGVSRPAPAQEPGQRLYVITHVDIFGPSPAAALEAAKMLQQFAADSRNDPGSVRFEVLREPNRLNHFTLVEVWQSRQDFETHLATSHSKAFREKIQPMLGSPFDERLHILLQ
jgi:quinol monooxygenase YgiN